MPSEKAGKKLERRIKKKVELLAFKNGNASVFSCVSYFQSSNVFFCISRNVMLSFKSLIDSVHFSVSLSRIFAARVSPQLHEYIFHTKISYIFFRRICYTTHTCIIVCSLRLSFARPCFVYYFFSSSLLYRTVLVWSLTSPILYIYIIGFDRIYIVRCHLVGNILDWLLFYFFFCFRTSFTLQAPSKMCDRGAHAPFG